MKIVFVLVALVLIAYAVLALIDPRAANDVVNFLFRNPGPQ